MSINRSNLIFNIMVKRRIVAPDYEEVTARSEPEPPPAPYGKTVPTPYVPFQRSAPSIPPPESPTPSY